MYKKLKISAAAEIFLSAGAFAKVDIYQRNPPMHLKLIKNPDESKIIQYKIARVIYATTGASSLSAAEAMASMVANICIATARSLDDIATDKNIFECLTDESPRNALMTVDANDRGFDMCLRAVRRMLNGDLPDSVSGATRFHHADVVPKWATAIGYVAEIDGILFYKG